MNTQETYEHIRAFFLKQGALAKVEDKDGEYSEVACLYRSPDGLKCAVGCLIPDDLYDEDQPGGGTLGELMEGNNVNGIADLDRRIKEIVNGDDLEGQRKLQFLMMAQSEHDTPETHNVVEFISKLDALAGESRLTVIV